MFLLYYRRVDINEGGRQVVRLVRDFTAARPWASRGVRKKPQSAALLTGAPVGQPTAGLQLAQSKDDHEEAPRRPRGMGWFKASLPQTVAAARKREADRTVRQLRADAEAEAAVARWNCTLELAPRSGPTATERLESLRAWVAATCRSSTPEKRGGRNPPFSFLSACCTV